MRYIILLFLVMGLLFGCSTATDPIDDVSYQTIGTATDGDVTIEVLSENALEAGFNPVLIRVTQQGQRVNAAHITLAPLMDMGMMKHSCPTEQPPSTANAEGLFPAAVFFTMGGSSDQWSIQFTVNNTGTSTEHELSMPVTVLSSSNVSVIKDGMNKTVITLQRQQWRAGMNEVRVAVHQTSDGFAFVPRTDLTVSIEPTMPSMGHGSEGNVNPTHEHDSWYRGKVNFTMTGEWDLHVTLGHQEEPLTDAHFLVEVR